jgi:hypothetical protein
VIDEEDFSIRTDLLFPSWRKGLLLDSLSQSCQLSLFLKVLLLQHVLLLKFLQYSQSGIIPSGSFVDVVNEVSLSGLPVNGNLPVVGEFHLFNVIGHVANVKDVVGTNGLRNCIAVVDGIVVTLQDGNLLRCLNNLLLLMLLQNLN